MGRPPGKYLDKRYTTELAKGHVLSSGRKKISISFEAELFDTINVYALLVDISFMEAVRRLVQLGFEYRDKDKQE